MSKDKFPVTTATRFLKDMKIPFEQYIYDYEEKGGTRQTAEILQVDEHKVIKTLVMRDDKPLLVLMHGDKEVSTKELARQMNVKAVAPADANSATKATGYQFGGTSPFGTKTELRVFAEKSIFDLDIIYINGGKRGFIISMNPHDLKTALNVREVEVAV